MPEPTQTDSDPSVTTKSSKPRKSQTLKKAKAPAKRQTKPYPTTPFQDVIKLAEAIHQHAAGMPVKRDTIFGLMQKKPYERAGRELITSSGKYGLTIGSYSAESLELTEKGAIATNPSTPGPEKLKTQFELAIGSIEPFNHLYTAYRGKIFPAKKVLLDLVESYGQSTDEQSEIVDTFIANSKFIGLLQIVEGAEHLQSIESAIGDSELRKPDSLTQASSSKTGNTEPATNINWETTCFYLAPIGEEGSEQRKHSDLFLGSLVEPAVKEFGLNVVRADKIGDAGMITSQIMEYITNARLAIVDLSFHNPNAFYEMALRHACKLPIVQITRKADRLPFDVNQVRTIVIDTSDIYALVPRIETYRAEISGQVRSALSDSAGIPTNPLTAFFPDFEPMRARKGSSKKSK